MDAQPLYLDPSQPLDARIADLVGRFTLAEKVTQFVHDSPAVERLGVPAYNWWNECLHGVARAGRATVFPQAIGLAASFDSDLFHRVATAISDEARAKYHESVAHGIRGWYRGLTFWTPNINIFRDPRWGRGQETYGEDPWLTATLGVAFVQGLQGNDPRYLKAAACAKHYAVHSGPEISRHRFDARVSLKDLRETYLPAFRALVVEAAVESVMGAYNRTNGEPCCGSPTLLRDILRGEWGFLGHVVSDCWALNDFHTTHGTTKSWPETLAMAFENGLDVICGCCNEHLLTAVQEGLLPEKVLDVALGRLLRTRFKLGLFDPEAMVPYAAIPPSVVCSPAHRALAREAAQKSIVLLKNDRAVLPLSKAPGKLKRLYVSGPNATDVDVLLGNYNGYNERLVTVIEGIVGKVHPTTSVEYRKGTFHHVEPTIVHNWAINDAATCDAVVLCLGLHPTLEGEEGESIASDNQGDRKAIDLPAPQLNFLKKVAEKTKAKGTPLIVVLFSGSAIACPEVHELADAVLWAGYPGEEGGNAVADVLFGDVTPAGRLPITWYRRLEDLPPYEDYALTSHLGRTYRYFTGDPLYPFGFGLSYSQFRYGAAQLAAATIAREGSTSVTVSVTNTGAIAATETVQLYVTDLETSTVAPKWALRGVQRVTLTPGATAQVTFAVTPGDLALVGDDGVARVEPGRFQLTIGSCSPGARGHELGAPAPAVALLHVE